MKFQPKRIYVILLIILFGISFFLVNHYIDKITYDRDVKRLYDSAGKLGWTQEKHLNFFRSYASGFGLDTGSYDVVELLYKTDQSSEEFSLAVKNLGFKGYLDFTDNSHIDEKDYNFLDKYTPLKEKLYLQNKKSGLLTSNYPKTYAWILESKDGQQITIEFAESMSENTWLYDRKKLGE